MPQFIMPIDSANQALDFNSLDNFVQGYVEAIFFTECHSDKPELEHMTFGDLVPESLAAIIEDCRAFQDVAAFFLEQAYSNERKPYSTRQAGTDFWFTRNGHGAGFWDRGLGDIGRALSDLCGWRTAFGEKYVFADDDGKMYVE